MDDSAESLQLRKNALVRAIRGARGDSSLPLLPRKVGESDPDLSYAQERLWVLDQVGMAGSAYNVPMALRMRGRLDVQALERAFAEIVRRHESLRTRIDVAGERAVQRIDPPGAFAIEQLDLRVLGAQPAEVEARRRMQAQIDEPFDLSRGPLLRVQLLILEPTVHVLLVTMHHIISDGWSLGLLQNELRVLYRAYADRQPSPLQDLPVQYADYAIWQRQGLQGERLQQHLQYWRAHLESAPSALELPCDRPRPGVQSYRGRTYEFGLGGPLTGQLKELSRQEGTTLFMVLLAAFKVLLWKLSGHSDIVVGTPIAGRTDWKTQELIGFFVNTLALRTRLGAHATFREHLLAVKGTALTGFAHQALPFERVVQELHPERDAARQPVFQVMFVLQNAPREVFELPGLELEGLAGEWVSAKFDLSLILQESAQGLLAGFEYATDLFDPSTPQRWADHYVYLLEQIVHRPEARLRELHLLRPLQRQQILVEWNRTERPYPHECTVHELFEHWADPLPDAVAVQAGENHLTYRELNERANQLAAYLHDQGVGFESRVAVCAERSTEIVVAFLGILKAGAAYVPLETACPRERLAYLVQDSAPVVVLTQGLGRAALGDVVSGLRCVDLQLDSRLWADCPKYNSKRWSGTSAGHSLAYVIYTSGSTGMPKGVAVSHSAVSRLVVNNGYADFTAADRVAFAANPAFDASTLEVWAPLLNGGAVVVIDQATLLDPERFAAGLLRHSVTVLWLTVGLFNQYASALTRVIPRLRYLIVGGDVLDPQIIAQVFSAGRPQHLLNGYGPTETTTFATTYEVTASPQPQKSVPIGRPVANARLYVLDQELEPVPVGVVGELFIGGAGVARGYLGQPALTAERFIPDPFGHASGERMYRTGDLARYLPDGNLEFIGRNDQQIKIRGYRIELAEIEAALQEHPTIRHAAVVARGTDSGKQLVAYVVREAHAGEVSAVQMREHLLKLLPEYMIPAVYVGLDALPLTANGKLDRKALPAPDQAALVRQGYEAPRGETETALARIWAQVLKIERVGREDNFFELGGHSLLAVTLIGRVRRALEIEVAIKDLFVHPVLWSFAQALAGSARSEQASIPIVARPQLLPLSFAQQRLWFLGQIEGGSQAYHMPSALRLKGRLERSALRRALDRIVQRHEGLRTSFEWVGEQPVQRIAPPESGFALQEHDLSGHAGIEEELERRLAAEALRGFDLEHGPLIRGQLLWLSEDEHVLAVTMHHIVSDGWSIGIFVKELSELYRSYSAGREDPLASLAIQYADYALWQRQRMVDPARQREGEYWQAALEGAPALLELPTDRARPAQQSFAGAAVEVELGADLTRDLKGLCQRHGLTLYMVMLAAWAAVLSRLSGQAEVVIGTPVANRMRAEIEGLIGFFVNMQALRIEVRGSVVELLERVKARALDAQSHQELPFDQVVERLNPPRSVAYAPVFQVTLAWQNNEMGTLELPGLELSAVPVQYGIAKFDLELTLQEQGERIVGTLGYATALFDRETIERQVGYLRRMLTGMVAGEGQTVQRIELLDEAQRQRLLVSWNQTDRAYPQYRGVHELFEAQVARTPNATAVVYEGHSLTYAELNERANQLAWYLRERQIGPDERVGICVKRSLEMVIGLLGILKAGGAYVPLDPSYPLERLHYMLGDAAPRVLLIQEHLRERLPSNSAEVIALDGQWSEIALRPSDNPDAATVGLESHHLAYVIYTSGSTGKPKGVMVEHAGLLNYLQWVLETYALESGAAVPVSSPLAFDATVTSLYSPLLSGRAVVLIPSGQELEGLEHLLQQSTPWSLVKISPAHLQALGLRLQALRLPCTVGAFVIGGEALPPATVELWRSLWPQTRLINEYGPTETVVGCCVYDIPLDWITAGSVPIGRPIANTRILILDAYRQPVPIGVTGEIYIGGAGVARGYLNRVDLTAERFIKDPFSTDPRLRLYKTGDLGRWRADSTIEYLGRNDEQVKIRGFRVELGEIRAQLLRHPQVKDAIVLAREDEPGEKRLVAYVVSQSPVETLRVHLKAVLPDYMLPSAFVMLESLPLTAHGKLDRKALPAPDRAAVARQEYEAPVGEMERALAGIWAQVLKVERVGREDNFFELGGHSLLAVTLIGRVRRALEIEVAIKDLFVHPVLWSFAQVLAGGVRSEQASIPIVARPQWLPLSFAQQRLWFLGQIEGGSQAYHIPAALRLKGRLDRNALRRALDRIVQRHEGLRTSFAWAGEQPVQRIAPPESGFALQEHDLSGHAGIEEELERRLAAEALRGFDLERGPLIRGQLLRLSEDERVLAVTMHHIVSDGWSTGVIVKELSELYRAYGAGREDPLAPLAIQYADYALWQRQRMDDPAWQREGEYWQAALEGAPALLDLPTDRARPAQQSFAGDTVVVELDAGLTRDLRRLCQRHGLTLYMVVLAAWAAVLSRLSGQAEVVIGTPVANRMRAELEGLIGFFVNMQALRIEVRGSVVELLEQVKARALDAQSHQELPFEQVVERLKPPRSVAYAPVFQAMLAWHNNEMGTLELPGLELSAVPVRYGIAKFDLELSLQEQGEGIAGTLGYVTALFDRETMQRQVGYLRRMLAGMAAGEDQAVQRIELLDEAQRQRLLVGWNQTDRAYPQCRSIHELFEAQVARTPSAAALVYADHTLTYAELNERANRLAHYLRSLGARPDERVGLCLERSVEMVVGILAILKSGGAYVPLEPDYPPERLWSMLNDSAPVVTLVDRAGLRTLERLSQGDGRPLPVLDVEADAQRWARMPGSDPAPVGEEARHLAYVIYTSGSTGRPKGVMNEHRGVINRLLWMQETYGLTVHDVVLQKTPFSFDVSVWEFFWPLMSGARLVLARPAGHKDPDYLCELIRAARVTTLHFVPSMLQAFLDYAAASSCTGIVRVICSGEALSAALVRSFHQQLPGAQLHNLYGPTEAAVDVSAWACLPADERSVIPIGRPIANTRLYILDEWLQPVPPGVSGELFIGGVQVARGYLNQPDLTRQRFIPDPFGPEPTGRLYRTGDLARWCADGTIEYLGRNDFQVKIRGFRIELGEIEAQLAACPGVRAALVSAREDMPGDWSRGSGDVPSGEKRLVAYLVPASADEQGTAAADALAREVRESLSRQLPEYMIPAAYVVLDALPLTANGKLDRKALPAPDQAATVRQEYEAPRGETETALARIWAQVLKVERVGREDNFFELGGHSLLALQLIATLKRAGIEATVIDLLNGPTVRSLAKYVTLTTRAAAEEGGAIWVRGGTQPPLFLAHDGYGDQSYVPALARYLPTSVPIYSLPSVPQTETPLETVEALAARLVRLIKAVRPTGPYRLAGWSFGGLMVYEVTQQLLDQGARVEFLGLLDTICPDAEDVGSELWRTPAEALAAVCQGTAREGSPPGSALRESIARLDKGAGFHDPRFQELLIEYLATDSVPESLQRLTIGQVYDQCGQLIAHTRAQQRYRPRPIQVPVHLFIASETIPTSSAPARTLVSGWERYVTPELLNVMRVPGNHWSMMRSPCIQVLGQRLTRALAGITCEVAA